MNRVTEQLMAGRRRPVVTPRGARGLTLVELMVAMLLGLIVIGVVLSVFLAGKQSFRTNFAVGEVGDSGRIAFELLGRDIRQAGLTGCGNLGRVANVLNNSPAGGGTAWWANWSNAVMGYDGDSADPATTTGSAVGQRVGGTDSIELVSTAGSGLSVASHDPTSATIKLNEASASLQPGDIVVVCDPDHAAITQITNYNSANVTLVHNTGNSVSPGNCSKGLGYPTQCATVGNTYTFGPNSQIALFSADDWFIGNNPAGGRSLYRAALDNAGGTISPTAQEMVRGVTDMQILYHQRSTNNFVAAGTVTSWADIDAVQVTLTLQSDTQRVTTDSAPQPLTRMLTSTFTLRNRVS